VNHEEDGRGDRDGVVPRGAESASDGGGAGGDAETAGRDEGREGVLRGFALVAAELETLLVRALRVSVRAGSVSDGLRAPVAYASGSDPRGLERCCFSGT